MKFLTSLFLGAWIAACLATSQSAFAAGADGINISEVGLTVGPVDPDAAKHVRLERPHGALVLSVSPGGAAEGAGLRARDVIVNVGNTPVEQHSDLPDLLRRPSNQFIRLEFKRRAEPDSNPFFALADRIRGDDYRQTATVLLLFEPGHSTRVAIKIDALRVLVFEMNEAELRQGLITAEGRGGVVVAAVTGATDFRPGDVILRINKRPVYTVQEIGAALRSSAPGVAEISYFSRRESFCCKIAKFQLPAMQTDVVANDSSLVPDYEQVLAELNRGEYARAMPWLKRYAEHGHPDAQYNLGLAYEVGKGVQRDAAEAARWYRLAAEQRNASSQEKLGFMYLDGKGVTRDEVEGERWLRKAAEQGSQRAKTRLNELLARNSGLSQSQPANNPGNGEAKVESASSAGTASAASPPVDCSTVCTEAGGGRICSTPVGCTPDLPPRSDAVNSAANGPASGQAPSTGLSLDNALDIAGTLLGITSAVQGVRRGGGTPAPAVVSPGSGARPSANYCEDMLRMANQCLSSQGNLSSLQPLNQSVPAFVPGPGASGGAARPATLPSRPGGGQAGAFQACYRNYMEARRAAGCP